MAPEKGGKPLKPSWIDRFNDWVWRLPLRPWIFYTLLGVALILIQILFLWLEGGSFASELLPVIIYNGLAVPYLLALIWLLDNQALRALDGMKSVLNLSQAEFETYKVKISTMPFLAPLLAGLAMTVFAILLPLVAIEPQRYAALEQTSFFSIIYQVIDLSSAFLFGVVLYHTIRQLRLVYAINSSHIQVNIFQLRPVQAFSRLTASTALGLVFFFYGWILLNPELLADPAILVVSLLFTALAVLVFVWPLWGMHSLMVSEKEQALQEIEQQFEGLFNKFNHYVTSEDYDAAQELSSAIMSLEIQHNKVNDMPTWPWRSETARIVLTAVALPILLMIVQFFVQQAMER
jgi:hypothetical protein